MAAIGLNLNLMLRFVTVVSRTDGFVIRLIKGRIPRSLVVTLLYMARFSPTMIAFNYVVTEGLYAHKRRESQIRNK